MSVAIGKALVEMTQKELLALLSPLSTTIMFGYNDILHELERKRMLREASRTFRLSLAALVIAGLSLFASVLLAIFK